MKHIIKQLILITIFALSIILIVNPTLAFGDPKIVSTIEDAFEDIQSWILKISTPAAAVAVGTGIFMKKFSFGDEEKIRTGKKVIRGTLFSYGFILVTDLILSAINSLMT